MGYLEALFTRFLGTVPLLRLAQCPASGVVSGLWVLNFHPPMLLSRGPARISSDSPRTEVFRVYSLAMTYLASGGASDLRVRSFSSFCRDVLLFHRRFFGPNALSGGGLIYTFPFLRRFVRPRRAQALTHRGGRPDDGGYNVFFALGSVGDQSCRDVFVSGMLAS